MLREFLRQCQVLLLPELQNAVIGIQLFCLTCVWLVKAIVTELLPKDIMRETNLRKKIILVRGLIPLSLAIACLMRVNFLSFCYGVLALVSPLIDAPAREGVPLESKRYLQVVLGTSLISCFAQLVFHVTLLVNPPYGHYYVDCDYHEKLVRQFGFQRLNSADGLQMGRLILPELALLFISMYAYVTVIHRRARRGLMSRLLISTIVASPIVQASQNIFEQGESLPAEQLETFLKMHNMQDYVKHLVNVFLICVLVLAGIVHPSLVSVVYFAVFLGLTSWWTSHREFSKKFMMRLKLLLLIYCFLHLILLYLYQFEFFQEALPPQSFGARFLGFTALVETNCENVRQMFLWPGAIWPYFFNPIILTTLYILLAVQMRSYWTAGALDSEEELQEDYEARAATATRLRSSGYGRRTTAASLSVHSTTQPAITLPAQYENRSAFLEAVDEEEVPEELRKARNEEEEPEEVPGEQRSRAKSVVVDVELPKVDVSSEVLSSLFGNIPATFLRKHPRAKLRRNATVANAQIDVAALQKQRGMVKTVIAFINHHSYVMSLVMMMAWSITYHSWSTFILLLIACVGWMVPNPRNFCLRLSPFIAAYANLLLVVQFIYGLNLTEYELPDERPPVLRQLGFEKPRGNPPCVTMVVKTLYSIMFWITARHYVKQCRLKKQKEVGGVALMSFQFAFSMSQFEGPPPAPNEEPVAVGPSKAQGPGLIAPIGDSSEKIRQFGVWLRRALIKYWIFISAGILLIISLRTPVVAYRIIYMCFFLVFIAVFQMSFRYWRKMLYYYYMIMIVYCMAVLSLIYTYQFHGFPELWHNGTGASYDVLDSIGLEVYSSGELFIQLLTPITFLVITIIQINFFHQDLMVVTASLEAMIPRSVDVWGRKRRQSSLSLESSTSSGSHLLSAIQGRNHVTMRKPLPELIQTIPSNDTLSIYENQDLVPVQIPHSLPILDPNANDVVVVDEDKLQPSDVAEDNEKNDKDKEKKKKKTKKNLEALSSPKSQKTVESPQTNVARSPQTNAAESPRTNAADKLQQLLKSPDVSKSTEDDTTTAKENSRSRKRLLNLKQQVEKNWMEYVETCWGSFSKYQDQIAGIVWRLLEIHIAKIINITMIAICISEVSALNIPYMVFVAISLPFEAAHLFLSHLACVWSCCIIIIKMLYQMKFVKESNLQVLCPNFPTYNVSGLTTIYFTSNQTVNSTAWAGLHKADNVAGYLERYMLLLLLLTLQTLVQMRQGYTRRMLDINEPDRGVLLPPYDRISADKGLPSCLLYFANYFFYKFGLEICFLSTVFTMAIRMDFMAILYGVWLMGLMSLRRKKVAEIWSYYVIYLAVMLPVQYLMCVGIPPTTCAAYPWSKLNTNMVEWLFLPDYTFPPNPVKLGADFLQFLCASCQLYVFRIEISDDAEEYPGGSNAEIIYEKDDADFDSEENPVPDFITFTKSYLDLLKLALFMYLYWATLAFVFIAGVSRVTMFAMGYVVGCFLFLWVGNELFLRPMRFTCRLWNVLIAYTVVVVFLKTSLQVVGCVYLHQLFRNYCWVLQLFGIACLKTGMDPKAVLDPKILGECSVPTEEAGIKFDGICLFFLLLQRRVICSYYFKHVIAEFRAQQVFASRGAELINKITMKKIGEQQNREQEIVTKIKRKMEKIRQSHGGMGARPPGAGGGPGEGGGASLAAVAGVLRSAKRFRQGLRPLPLPPAPSVAPPTVAAPARASPGLLVPPVPRVNRAPSNVDPEDLELIRKMEAEKKETSVLNTPSSPKLSPEAVEHLPPTEASSPSSMSIPLRGLYEFGTNMSLKDHATLLSPLTPPPYHSLYPSLAGGPGPGPGLELLSPGAVKEMGVERAREQILNSGQRAPTAYFDENPMAALQEHAARVLAEERGGLNRLTPPGASVRCHIVGPNVVPSPGSDQLIPFVTSPEGQWPARVTTSTDSELPPMKKRPPKLKQLQKAFSTAAEYDNETSALSKKPRMRAMSFVQRVPSDRRRKSTTTLVRRQHSMSAPQRPITTVATKQLQQHRKQNMDESPQGDMDYFTMEEETSDDEMPELEVPGESEAVPETEEDRRKGLGPLQLLNVAFKKGAIREAVKDAKKIENEQKKLEKQLKLIPTKRSEKKAIRKRLMLKTLASKPLADFEEETFDEEHISTDVVGRDYVDKYGVAKPRKQRSSESDDKGSAEVVVSERSSPGVTMRRASLAAESGGSRPVLQDADDLGKIGRGYSSDQPSPLEEEEEEESGTEDYDGRATPASDLKPETAYTGESTGKQSSAIFSVISSLIDLSKNAWIFVKLFVTGVVESMITWLLKVSRDYRYVAHVLAAEKKAQKEIFAAELKARSFASLVPVHMEEKLTDTHLDHKTKSEPIMTTALLSSRSDAGVQVKRVGDLRRQSLVLIGLPAMLSPAWTGSASDRRSSGSAATAGASFCAREQYWKARVSVQMQRRNTGYSFDEEAEEFGKKQNMFVRLFVASYYVLISRSELFCYLMVVLNHMNQASLLSMILPFMTFLWGTLSVPKPSKLFWISVITYTEAMVVIKYLFQFGFFPWNKSAAPPDPFWPPRILGIEKKEKYAGWDLALLMTLFFHRSILKTMGLWKDTDVDMDELELSLPTSRTNSRRSSKETPKSSVKSSGKLAFAKAKDGTESDQQQKQVKSEKPSPMIEGSGAGLEGGDAQRPKFTLGPPQLLSPDDDNLSSSAIFQRIRFQRGMTSYWQSLLNFFRTLLNPEYRCSVDAYAPMFVCDFICFLIVVFGYWAFGTDTGAGGVASVFEENKVPVPFLVMLIVQFALIIIDRALFLRKFLFGKLVYQLGLVIFIHIWMFMILPAITERMFANNFPAKLWYFTKCVYFCLSAWQIRSGYPTRILGNFLTKKYNYINMLLFKGFMAIPFLFELRALMDWIWTDTSMSLGDWLKLEDIYANIYEIKCQRKAEEDYPTPRGSKRRPIVKYGFGGSLLIFIILIIWFPLVLFSLANTVGMRNLPTDCTVKLTLGQYQPIFQMSAQQSFLQHLSDEEFDALLFKFRLSKAAMSYMADYSSEDVVKAVLMGSSTSIWGISPPSKLALINDLMSNSSILELKFEWHFTRPPEGRLHQPVVTSADNVITLPPGDKVRLELAEMLMGHRSTPVTVPRLFAQYVKVPGHGKATAAMALAADKIVTYVNESYVDVTLKLESGTYLSKATEVEWWKVKMLDPDWDPQTDPGGPVEFEELMIFGFVDKVFPSTLNFFTGGGIISFYLSLVLVVGRLVRTLVTGAMYKIMFEELPNVDRILQLCLDIFLVRESGELELEEDLFAKLIFLYRSPATLIKWTRKKDK